MRRMNLTGWYSCNSPKSPRLERLCSNDKWLLNVLRETSGLSRPSQLLSASVGTRDFILGLYHVRKFSAVWKKSSLLYLDRLRTEHIVNTDVYDPCFRFILSLGPYNIRIYNVIIDLSSNTYDKLWISAEKSSKNLHHAHIIGLDHLCTTLAFFILPSSLEISTTPTNSIFQLFTVRC